LNLRERIGKLPLVLGFDLGPDECIEEMYDDAKVIATHTYVAGIGMAYHCSFSGSMADRLKLINEVTKELGLPIMGLTRNPKIWHFFWPSSSEEVPESDAHKRLGRGQIHAICQQFGLTKEEERTVDIILAITQVARGNKKASSSLARDFMQELPPEREKNLLDALEIIATEFLKSTRH